jgi:hypothetical protein
VATTTLLLPFSFWVLEDKETPASLAKALLSRTLLVSAHQCVRLWERGSPASGVSELSLHFRQLLGGADFANDPHLPVQHLRLTAAAQEFLFGDSRLWAYTKAGDYVGRYCEWTSVRLIVFPHGAVLSITIDWIPPSCANVPFTLSDLRTWVYVSKFRSIKVGVTRGWTFAQHAPLESEKRVSGATAELGLKLYAALFGGSGVALGSVANWLVKMPTEDASALPRRISRHDYCMHHSFAQVERRPREKALEKFLFHIRRAHGAHNMRPVPSAAYLERFSSDQNLYLSEKFVISGAREGVFALEWGRHVQLGTEHRRATQFMGLLLELNVHCLSERLTLERLSFFAALQSVQSVDSATKHARISHTHLCSMLIQFRTSMASDDCGGSADARAFFKMVRNLHRISSYKLALLEQVQDAKYIMDCEWKADRTLGLDKDRRWMLHKEHFALKSQSLKDAPKLVFDVVFFSFIAITVPFIFLSTLWGSNQDDLPRDVPWNTVVIVAGVISAVFLAFFVLMYVLSRKSIQVLEGEQRMHLSKGERDVYERDEE